MSASSTLARGYLKVAVTHADSNDMSRATQAVTIAIIMGPELCLRL
jgi:hypothetical protein